MNDSYLNFCHMRKARLYGLVHHVYVEKIRLPSHMIQQRPPKNKAVRADGGQGVLR